jgi:hypothetical protein
MALPIRIEARGPDRIGDQFGDKQDGGLDHSGCRRRIGLR